MPLRLPDMIDMIDMIDIDVRCLVCEESFVASVDGDASVRAVLEALGCKVCGRRGRCRLIPTPPPPSEERPIPPGPEEP